MSYFIIIRGPLGIGKSTISEKLAKILNATVIHMDNVLEKNGLDKVPSGAECIPASNFIKANEIVLPEVEKILKNGKIVIFDACFYHQTVIDHLIQKLPFNHYVFTLKASLDICITRDRNRLKPYGEAAAKAVYRLVSRFDNGINIDVSGELSDVVKVMISYLPKSLG